MRPLSFLSEQAVEEYGQKEMATLCHHYGQATTHSWRDDGVENETTVPPLINTEDALREWRLVKQVVRAEQYPQDSMWKLWALIVRFHKKEFPTLTKLAQLGVTLAVQTAGCERGFSAQNFTLTAHRNRLTIDMQERLLRVKLGPARASFPFDSALQKWRASKERRLYELKVK